MPLLAGRSIATARSWRGAVWGRRFCLSSLFLKSGHCLRGGQASAPFDGDGLPTYDRDVISAGVLNGYFLSVYSARKLGMGH